MDFKGLRPKYRWEQRHIEDPALVQSLAADLNDLPIALARSLVLRGVSTLNEAKLFFRPDLTHLHDPFLMTDMDAAAERLAEAAMNKEKVLVYGDYDVDGVTSTVLMYSFLQSIGVDVEFFIPNRTVHGYGLCNAGFDVARDAGCSLVVALDCGITAIQPARYARSLGIDLVICDHHTAGETIPDAVAVLDPKRPDCNYPFPHLSGCGVGFKLTQAVTTLLGEDHEKTNSLLDLVAISIASDIVPINGENRVLMRAGLDLLQKGPRLGTRVLASIARLNLSQCNTSQIVFGIAPRINAAGRLEDAGDAARLLLESNQGRATQLAKQIEATNDRRKKIDQYTETHALGMAEEFVAARDRDAFVLYDGSWHAGVIGITASRVVERFFRPTVMLTNVDGKVKGSARSIFGVNVYDALNKCSDLLIQFGGHDFAAGMQLEPANIDAFRERFEQAVTEQLTPELRQPAIRIDAPIHLSEIDERFWAVLRQFEPFGPANARPVFHATNLEIVGNPRTMGKSGEHLKFTIRENTDSSSRPREVVGFGMKDYLPVIEESRRSGQTLEMSFTLDENLYGGRRTLQLRPKDLRMDGEPVSESSSDSGMYDELLAVEAADETYS